ncbi:hypothetical protein [Streptomyces sp. NPDC016845]|uniref:hypothetical protein n=1 Tax=Streptomyces sp. NPDC016845 TaxID=3364972 RepID=UPI0037AC941E
MAHKKKLPCETCGGDETHHPLDKEEQRKLVKAAGVKHPHEFWMCDGDDGDCQNLRTGFNKRPFGGGPRKL